LFQDQNSKKLETSYDANSARQGSGTINSRRPFFPEFGPGISMLGSEGTSRYDALELSLKKTSTHYTFWWSHTWAKKLGWGLGPFETSNIVNVYDKAAFYGPARYVPHLNKVSFLVDLPVGRTRRWVNRGGVADAVLGGWTAGGFFTLHQSGEPLTVTWSGDSANVGVFSVRPNRVCSGKLSSPTEAKWFETSCFTSPTPGTFGNSGSGILFGPSMFFGDFSLHKNFAIRENVKLQFRSEFFNVFNHPNLQNPGTLANGPNFGRSVTKILDPRVIQFSLRLNY
jgi:hypothetical protein